MHPRVRTLLGWAVLDLGVLAIVLSVLRAEQQLAAINFHVYDDWRTYANAVDRWLAGQPIYSAVQTAGPYRLRDTLLTGFTYPPSAVLLFAPFAAPGVGQVAWLVLLLGSFLTGLFAILKRELGTFGPFALGLTLLALAAFPPFGNAVVSGNLNLGVAALVAWSWVLVDQTTGVSAAAGLGATLKLFPGLIASWPMRSTGWRAMAVAIGTAVVVVAVTLPLVGVDAWPRFVAAFANAEPECAAQSISFSCSLGGVLGTGGAWLLGVVVALLLAVVAWRARSPLVAYAAMAGSMLAPVVDMHPHYWLIAWVVAFVVFVRVVGRRSAGVRSVP